VAESFFGVPVMIELLEANPINRHHYQAEPRAAELSRGGDQNSYSWLPLARLGCSFLPKSFDRARGIVAMDYQAFWRFKCPECGVGDRELGHMLTAEELYCIVCLDETERRVRLQRWEVVQIDLVA